MSVRRTAAWVLAALAFWLIVPQRAMAHNVTFRAVVTVGDDGQDVEVYVDDVIRNPVPAAVVTVSAAGASATLAETEPGLYVGRMPQPLETGDRVSVQVEVGVGDNRWSGSGRAAVGGETEWVLTHQHGIDGRTFSIVMTAVFGGLLAVIAVYEAVRLGRRRRQQKLT